MDNIAIQSLLTNSLTEYGDTALIILTAVIGVSVAYLAFRFGWAKIKGSIEYGSNSRSSSHRFEDNMGTFWPTKAERDASNRMM